MKTSPTTAPTPVVRLIPQLLDYAAHQYGDGEFLLRNVSGRWQGYSFRAAARAMHSFTALLERAGVRPGDRVGLQSENRPEWGLAYLAILEAGAVVVPLDAQLKAQEVGEILSASGSRWCVTSGRQLPVIRAACEARGLSPGLFGLDPLEGIPGWVEAQRDFPEEAAREERAQPGDLAIIIFTSGTTGQAKGVMLSHQNILSNVEGVARTFEFGPGDRLLSILPLHHTFEATLGFLSPLRMGASIAYARGLDSKQLREDMASSGVTVFAGVPLLYEKLLTAIHRGISDLPVPRRLLVQSLLGVTRLARRLAGLRLGGTLLRPVREKAGLGRVRMFATGAAAMPEEVFWGYIDLGIPMVEGYGLTETSPVVAANRPRRPTPGAVGWPLMGVEVRIDEPDAEGDGEILVRGPNIMLGYHENPEATAEVMRDGWFCTGDLGRVLPDGRLKITGRLKNMIATAAGKKIYPEEVEAQLANSPYVLEVVVLGAREGKDGREEVHAHVFPDLPAIEAHAQATGAACDDAYVERIVRADVDRLCEALAAYKRVKRVVIRRAEFAKTTTGKIKRMNVASEAAETVRATGVA